MYFINYYSGATRWCKELDIKSVISQFTTGSIVSIIDAENQKIMIRNNDQIVWAPLLELEEPSDEEVKAFQENFDKNS